MKQDKRTEWLEKLDEECPYQVVLPRRSGRDAEIMKFLSAYVGQVRHVRGGRVQSVRSLLLRG
jgi:hypothetical protein